MNDLELIELRKQIEQAESLTTALDLQTLREKIELMAVVDKELPLAFMAKYYEALRDVSDRMEIAKLVAIMVMPSVNTYIQKELTLLGLDLSREENQNCQERCFERIVGYVSDHLQSADTLGFPLREYAMGLGMFLLNRSYKSINVYLRWPSLVSNRMAEVNKWGNLRRDIANFITIVTGETYDAANQLGNIQVVHYAAPVLDAIGREVMKRIKEGRLDELTMKDILKQFGDTCRLVADVKGDTATKIDVSHNLSGIFAAMNEMKAKGITVERPKRELIE